MQTKRFFITDNRFKYIGIILLIIWIGFMVFFYLKADEITKDPCGICAKQMSNKVVCTVGGIEPQMRTYYPNFTITDVDLGAG